MLSLWDVSWYTKRIKCVILEFIWVIDLGLNASISFNKLHPRQSGTSPNGVEHHWEILRAFFSAHRRRQKHIINSAGLYNIFAFVKLQDGLGLHCGTDDYVGLTFLPGAAGTWSAAGDASVFSFYFLYIYIRVSCIPTYTNRKTWEYICDALPRQDQIIIREHAQIFPFTQVCRHLWYWVMWTCIPQSFCLAGSTHAWQRAKFV